MTQSKMLLDQDPGLIYIQFVQKIRKWIRVLNDQNVVHKRKIEKLYVLSEVLEAFIGARLKGGPIKNIVFMFKK